MAGGAALKDLLMLSAAQMRRIEPYFPLSHGVPRVDDRRVLSGILFVIRNGLRWRDAPAGTVRNFVREAMMMKRRESSHGYREGTFGPVACWPGCA